MPSGLVWLGKLEWPKPEPQLARQRSAGGSARRPHRRRARRPPAWLTLRGWLPGPEDLFDPPPPDSVNGNCSNGSGNGLHPPGWGI